MPEFVRFESINIVYSKTQTLDANKNPMVDKQNKVCIQKLTTPTRLTPFFQPIMNNPIGTINVLPHLVDTWCQSLIPDQLALYLKRRFTFSQYALQVLAHSSTLKSF